MLRLQGNQLNKWIKQKAKGSEVPACTAAPTGRCLLWAELSWWVSARHSVLPQVNCPGKAGVSLSLCKCVCVCVTEKTSVHKYACVCAFFHPPTHPEGVRNLWEFVRHLEPSFLDLICVCSLSDWPLSPALSMCFLLVERLLAPTICFFIIFRLNFLW